MDDGVRVTSSGGEGQRQKQGNKQESKGEAEVGVELSTVQPGSSGKRSGNTLLRMLLYSFF